MQLTRSAPLRATAGAALAADPGVRMKATHFAIQGLTRTYWDFFLGAGFTVGVLYLFAAVLAWQLGGLPEETLARMRATVWGFACCFAAVTAVSCHVGHDYDLPECGGMAFREPGGCVSGTAEGLPLSRRRMTLR
jgi:hypothetical protein